MLIESPTHVRHVRVIGAPLPYRDGSEQRVGAAVASAADRSAGSAELAAAISDWPTRYHLDPGRGGLLAPLRLERGMRVLEIGAGMGALTTFLAACGAQVVALEGNDLRAKVLAERCSGYPNVEVLCGPLSGLDDQQTFDLVLAVGVLEYADAAIGGGLGARSFLARCRQLIGRHGLVALAIENQLGLRYLLGSAEDHLGVPFGGVTDYPGPPGVRTYSRRVLRGMLVQAGLPSQRWLYPYPDYKLPHVVLAEEAFAETDAARLVDQLVRMPSRPEQRATTDERRAHRVVVEAGLGQELAPSFLVVAGREEGDLERLVDSRVLAWRSKLPARGRLASTRIASVRDGQRVMDTVSTPGDVAVNSWLTRRHQDRRCWVVGPTVEQEALDACHQRDAKALQRVLACWWKWLDSRSLPPASDRNPYTGPWSAVGLPGDLLDVELSNLVRTADGELAYVDAEWQVRGTVDRDLVALRALWYFARDIVTARAVHPFEPSCGVDEVMWRLAALCGLELDPLLLDRFRQAEAALMHAIHGWSVDEVVPALRERGLTASAILADHPEDPVQDSTLRKLISARRELEQIHSSRAWHWWMKSIAIRRWLRLV